MASGVQGSDLALVHEDPAASCGAELAGPALLGCPWPFAEAGHAHRRAGDTPLPDVSR